MIALTLAALAGLVNGAREISHANLHIFETLFGASSHGFWGSESWLRKRDDKGLNITTFSDFWHLSEFLQNAWKFIAGILAGLCSLPLVRVLELGVLGKIGVFYLILHSVFGVASWTSYTLLERWNKEVSQS